MRLALCFLFALLLAFATLTLWPRAKEPEASELSAAAQRWVGEGEAQPPRRDGDEWEVDVRRVDGSLVEVTLGAGNRLLGLDEELGAGGGPAADEVGGPARARAARAALAAAGHGHVSSVEREAGRVIEVKVRRGAGQHVEVALGRSLEVLEVEPEVAGDE